MILYSSSTADKQLMINHNADNSFFMNTMQKGAIIINKIHQVYDHIISTPQQAMILIVILTMILVFIHTYQHVNTMQASDQTTLYKILAFEKSRSPILLVRMVDTLIKYTFNILMAILYVPLAILDILLLSPLRVKVFNNVHASDPLIRAIPFHGFIIQLLTMCVYFASIYIALFFIFMTIIGPINSLIKRIVSKYDIPIFVVYILFVLSIVYMHSVMLLLLKVSRKIFHDTDENFNNPSGVYDVLHTIFIYPWIQVWQSFKYILTFKIYQYEKEGDKINPKYRGWINVLLSWILRVILTVLTVFIIIMLYKSIKHIYLSYAPRKEVRLSYILENGFYKGAVNVTVNKGNITA